MPNDGLYRLWGQCAFNHLFCLVVLSALSRVSVDCIVPVVWCNILDERQCVNSHANCYWSMRVSVWDLVFFVTVCLSVYFNITLSPAQWLPWQWSCLVILKSLWQRNSTIFLVLFSSSGDHWPTYVNYASF